MGNTRVLPYSGRGVHLALLSQGDASLCPGLMSRGAFDAKIGMHRSLSHLCHTKACAKPMQGPCTAHD